MIKVNVMDPAFNQAYWRANRALPVERLETLDSLVSVGVKHIIVELILIVVLGLVTKTISLTVMQIILGSCYNGDKVNRACSECSRCLIA